MENQFKYISDLLAREVKCIEDVKNNDDKKIIKEALKKSWEIRNFEIELYWKRALYFWGFIAIAFASLIAILNVEQDILKGTIINKFFVLTINCIAGSILSFAWYLTNRGAKYWQENWEKWIIYLEEFTYGNLYKTRIEPKDMKTGLLRAGDYSLSRINIIISLLITFIWIGLTMFFAYNIANEHAWCFSIIALLLLIILGFCITSNAKSGN